TGYAGYVGQVLLPMLKAEGHTVVGLDTDLYRDADCAPFEQPDESIFCDMRDVDIEMLQGCDAVLHLAALSNDPLGNLDRSLTIDINFEASLRLAKLAREAGVPRFLFSSSCSMYGAAGDALLDEQAEFNPITPYGESKVLADRAISELATDDFSPTFLRNATAYGFSPRLRLDLVVNDFAAAAYLDKRIYIKSDGTPWRPLVHVADIAGAFVAILSSPRDRIHNEAFNVGATDENYRVSEVADIVQRLVPDCEIEYDPAGGPDKRCYRVQCEKLAQLIPEFQCKWTVEKGVAELLRAYKEFDLTRDAVTGKRYFRLAGLERRKQEGVIDDQLRPIAT
ncbi:MAG: SDR family oxidoreductase, partial [Planctomycetota bacterium]